MKAIIVGGGLGGVYAAITLERAGVDAVVLEAHDDLRKIQVGIGMVLWPNGTLALRAAELDDAVIARGAVIDRVEFRRAAGGSRLKEWRIGDVGRELGSPAVGISRADVHKVLHGALAAGTLRLGEQVTAYEEDADGITVRTESGDEVRGDVVIGADGLRSHTREHATHTDHTYPPYAGYTLWHAIIPSDPELVPPADFRLSLGRGDRFVSFPVDGERVYWSALSHEPAGGRDEGRRLEGLRQRYASYAPDVRGLIEATPESEISRSDIYGGRALPSWGTGRVTLLGDAAHPMTTILGQGACMALEDGAAIAHHLTAGTEDAVAALRAYEAERLDRTARVQKLVRRLSPGAESRVRAGIRDLAIQRVFERGPGGQLQALISEPFTHGKELSLR
jgi:2-polyprenyl-6-methoxyphenol hydroxylase-like FAD-dependent oxidoreductase